MKTLMGFRLTPDARGYVLQMAAFHGISQAAVVEMAVRRLARETLPPTEAPADAPPPPDPEPVQ
jgi:hypothetical protein